MPRAGGRGECQWCLEHWYAEGKHRLIVGFSADQGVGAVTIEVTTDNASAPAGSIPEVLARLAQCVDLLGALSDPGGSARVHGAQAAAVVAQGLLLAGRLTAISARA